MLMEPQTDARPETWPEGRLTDGIERAFWQRWVTDCPLELLQRIDLEIYLGRWRSRQEAFLDYAGGALSDIGANDQHLHWTIRWLAQSLLDQAEEQERLSQPALAG